MKTNCSGSFWSLLPLGVPRADTDFGQTDFGHPYLTEVRCPCGGRGNPQKTAKK